MHDYRDRMPLRPRVDPCAGWLAHNLKVCDCYRNVRHQARDAALKPRLFGGILCAFGRHRWAHDPAHWRRWCLECGHGNDAAPERPHAGQRTTGASISMHRQSAGQTAEVYDPTRQAGA